MKLKNYLFAGLFAVGLLATSCSSNENEPTIESGDGVIKITLSGNTSSQTDLRAASTVTTEENAVKKFMVYVFNDNTETLEVAVTGTVGAPTTISGLSTGFAKRIVVVANQPSNFPIFYPGDMYTSFTESAAAINLDYQSVESAGQNGLVMTGEVSGINLSGTTTTEVTVPIKRVAAKVSLGAITLVPEAEYEEDLFEVTGVSVQRAVAKCDIYGNPVGNGLYCGVLGSFNSTVKSYLNDAISPSFTTGQPTQIGNYFYVLPNQSQDSCTLLTVAAKYDGDIIYFPVKLNAVVGSGTTDGTLIQSNKSYVLNLTINQLANGTTDPDVPPTTANLDLNISVADWDLVITQNEVW